MFALMDLGLSVEIRMFFAFIDRKSTRLNSSHIL